jgi:hypothetical protein
MVLFVNRRFHPIPPPRRGLLLLAVLLLAFIAGHAQELVTTWSGYTHPLNYVGRTLTRDSSGNYFAVIRGGNQVNIWKRTAVTGAWQNLGFVNSAPLSGREGDCAAIAVDGLDRVHVVYYTGSAPNLAHRMSADGVTFGPEHLIAAGVTWEDALAGGPFLHVDEAGHLHVAFVDGNDLPYYAASADAGQSWTIRPVFSQGSQTLRPSVITLPSGRILYGCAIEQFRCFYSDNAGLSWQEASPLETAYSRMDNCRLHALGNLLFVSGQKVLPEPRGIWVSVGDGTTMTWQDWEIVWSGDGADASMFVDSTGGLHAVWRQYPTQPCSVYVSSRTLNWARMRLTLDADYYIFPFAYWQEYHRGAPSDNRPAYLAPDYSTQRIYFNFINGLSCAPDDMSGIYPVTSFTGEPQVDRILLTWTNPADPAFAGTMIRVGTDGFPATPDEGALVCDRPAAAGSTDHWTHTGLQDNTVYYYAAFAYSAARQYAQPVFLKQETKPRKPSSLRIIDD